MKDLEDLLPKSANMQNSEEQAGQKGLINSIDNNKVKPCLRDIKCLKFIDQFFFIL